MNLQQNEPRRDFIKKTLAGSIALATGLSFSGTLLQSVAANAATGQPKEATAFNEKEFRDGVMPRAQLSMMASQLAVEKCSQKNAKEFAGFELMEAIAVIKVLKDAGTAVPAMSDQGKAFLEKLKSASGSEFDKLYMDAEQSNHEFLRDLAKNYLDNVEGKNAAAERETKHLATLALFAFTEHVAITKRINGELNG